MGGRHGRLATQYEDRNWQPKEQGTINSRWVNLRTGE